MSREGALGVPDVIGNRHHWDSGQTPPAGEIPAEVGDDDIRSTCAAEICREVRHHIEAGRRQLVREARADFIVCYGKQDEGSGRVLSGRASIDAVSLCCSTAHDGYTYSGGHRRVCLVPDRRWRSRLAQSPASVRSLT
jgi:hypothetical protein